MAKPKPVVISCSKITNVGFKGRGHGINALNCVVYPGELKTTPCKIVGKKTKCIKKLYVRQRLYVLPTYRETKR